MLDTTISDKTILDIAIIGGGINGCGIARDAAGRGWSVALFEMGDLASATSQWSTKLIHGGLRYLEHYEFRLVREALVEREVLMRIAPHVIHPLRFILPHHRGLRPAWLLRLGLFIYDHLGGRKLLPPTRTIDLRHHEAGKVLKPGYGTAFEYSDASVDDARLVVLNAMSAREHGADIHVRQRVLSAQRSQGSWLITSVDEQGTVSTHRARALVNAAGPWVADVVNDVAHAPQQAKVRLVQGSHIIVKKLFQHDKAYIFQNADGRIIFAIPWQGAFTLIGTTDSDYQGDPAKVAVSDADIAYLCASASEYFAAPVQPADVVWSYSGVRPLYDDGATAAQEATRDYVLTLDAAEGQPALLSIFGGKITTYRRLAEEALDRLRPHVAAATRKRAGWTGQEPLPGGDFAVGGEGNLAMSLMSGRAWLPEATARRFAMSYGTRAMALLEAAHPLGAHPLAASPFGASFGAGLSEAELVYLTRHEWASCADDVLWRRSKLGLLMTAEERDAIQAWFDCHGQDHADNDAP